MEDRHCPSLDLRADMRASDAICVKDLRDVRQNIRKNLSLEERRFAL
jgi:hypothetical protein